jgi:hypothetical protein
MSAPQKNTQYSAKYPSCTQTNPVSIQNKKTPSLILNYTFVFAAAALVYSLTFAPGLLWQDSGMIQYRVWQNDIQGSLGLALSHPLFYVIAIALKYIPFAEFPARINIISPLASSFAVANLFLLIRLITARTVPAIVAAVSLAIAHTFWRHACIIETYNLYAAFLLAELILLYLYTKNKKPRSLIILALLNGLALSVHLLAVIPLACYIIYAIYLTAKNKIKPSRLLACVIAWLAGAALYLYLITNHYLETRDLAATINSAFFGHSWKQDVLNTSMNLKIVLENMLFLALNFPTPVLLLVIPGLYQLKNKEIPTHFRVILPVITLLFLLFAFRYTIVDRYAFFIPFYCTIAVFIGLGSAQLFKKHNRLSIITAVIILSLMPLIVYTFTPHIARKFYPALGSRRKIPYRDNYTFFLTPWKTSYDGADRFARQALANVEQNAVIFADGTTAYPLILTQQIHCIRTDVKIAANHGSLKTYTLVPQNPADSSILKNPNIYTVSPVKGYCPEILLLNCRFQKQHPLYKAQNCGF